MSVKKEFKDVKIFQKRTWSLCGRSSGNLSCWWSNAGESSNSLVADFAEDLVFPAADSIGSRTAADSVKFWLFNFASGNCATVVAGDRALLRFILLKPQVMDIPAITESKESYEPSPSRISQILHEVQKC